MKLPLRNAVIAAVCLVGMTFSGRASNPNELQLLAKKASNDRSSKEGYDYETKFFDAIDPVLIRATDYCSKITPNTVPGDGATLVFVISVDGRITKFLHSENNAFAKCVGSQFKPLPKVPRPPRDGWATALEIGNRRHGPPPDKPRRVSGEEHVATFDKTIAPYIAKARATYPAAKRRFEGGLPSGYKFSVEVPLYDRDGTRENCFVAVERIKDRKISGTIDKVDLLTNYKTGQRITFPEDEIMNWVIVRPDGTEEGNYVGKFLDHYKPQ